MKKYLQSFIPKNYYGYQLILKIMIKEKDIRIFDLITFVLQNFTLIHDINSIILSDEHTQKNPITQYYLQWCKERLPEKHPYPFNPGTMLMMTSAIIISCTPQWLNYLPKTRISASAKEWGLQRVQLNYPRDQNPSIRTVVRKIRNSIAHSNMDFHVGDQKTPWMTFLEDSKFIFRDDGPFELEISVLALAELNKSIYDTISPFISAYIKEQEAQTS